MVRALYVLFAIVAYVIFFATFLYLVGFVGGLPGMPTSVDHGMQASTTVAGLIDLLLFSTA
jgi:hypothetical protein